MTAGLDMPATSDDEPLPTRTELAQEALRRLQIAVDRLEEFSVPDQVRVIHHLSFALSALRELHGRRPRT